MTSQTEAQPIGNHKDLLVSSDFNITERSKGHTKARTERAAGYPDRVPVADGTTWENLDKEAYHPVDYTADRVKAKDRTQDPQNPDLWADPENPKDSKNAPDFPSYEGKIALDTRGRPLNPRGPTGLEGRGILGNWGANNAADAIVTRINKQGEMEMIMIKRQNKEWAIPAGMVDRGEKTIDTVQRELQEETSVGLDFEDAQQVYLGYVDDPRNTDNAWMETDAYHIHLPEGMEVQPKAGDDAVESKWMMLTEESVRSLYASHADLIRRALVLWQNRTGNVVAKNGLVRISI